MHRARKFAEPRPDPRLPPRSGPAEPLAHGGPRPDSPAAAREVAQREPRTLRRRQTRAASPGAAQGAEAGPPGADDSTLTAEAPAVAHLALV